MKRLSFHGIGLMLAACGQTILAAANGVEIQPPLILPDAGTSVLRMFGALILVLALFFLGVWFFRNGTNLMRPGQATGKLHILECRSLGARHGVYVVGYDRQRYLVAASPTGVNLLAQLPEAAESASQSQAIGPNFADLFNRVIGRNR